MIETQHMAHKKRRLKGGWSDPSLVSLIYKAKIRSLWPQHHPATPVTSHRITVKLWRTVVPLNDLIWNGLCYSCWVSLALWRLLPRCISVRQSSRISEHLTRAVCHYLCNILPVQHVSRSGLEILWFFMSFQETFWSCFSMPRVLSVPLWLWF